MSNTSAPIDMGIVEQAMQSPRQPQSQELLPFGNNDAGGKTNQLINQTIASYDHKYDYEKTLQQFEQFQQYIKKQNMLFMEQHGQQFQQLFQQYQQFQQYNEVQRQHLQQYKRHQQHEEEQYERRDQSESNLRPTIADYRSSVMRILILS